MRQFLTVIFAAALTACASCSSESGGAENPGGGVSPTTGAACTDPCVATTGGDAASTTPGNAPVGPAATAATTATTTTTSGQPTTSSTGTQGGVTTQACGKNAPQVGFTPNHSITANGKNRTFGLFLPATYGKSVAYSIVIMLHGDGGTGAGLRTSLGTKMETESKEGAIFVYPDALASEGKKWQQGKAPATNDDLLFFDALLTELSQTLGCADVTHVYVAGFSGGAYFANQLGCQRGDKIKAIASNSGGGPYNMGGQTFDKSGQLVCPTPPVSVLLMNGNADTSVKPIEGEKARKHWTYWNKCQDAKSSTSPSPCQAQEGCQNGAKVVSCFIDGLAHATWTESAKATWPFFASIR